MSSPTEEPGLAYPEGDLRVDLARETPEVNAGYGADENLDQLRWLLLAPEQEQIEALRHRLDDPNQKTEELSKCLAEALTLRLARDRQLHVILQSLIEDAVGIAAVRDPQRAVEWLAPILGRGLRKALTGSLRRKLGSLNRLLTSTLTLEGWRWRLIARRSGDPCSVVALTRSRHYRVDQVFLIHRKTGRLLGEADEPVARQVELLSAIQTSSRDSARSYAGETSGDPDSTEVLKIGEQKLWLRHGPLATLAVMVSGNPPAAFGELLESESRVIHQAYGPELEEFDGDPEPVSGATAHLRGWLTLGRRRVDARTSYTALWALTLMIAAAAGALTIGRIRSDLRWEHYVAQLRK
ncbi:hypothetical protein [Acidisarcina polymorpha]|uniref:hypothetical protein n=1 Tax=Acidisarcina polymorpha TaxID=2211140 RepID=UPI000DF00A16|nr:hypothetical protein [Acidisarcina polymorpha]